MRNKIRVVELFAGVGGFRLGLEGWEGKSATSGYKEKYNTRFEIVWSNQWEPSTKIQHASMVYENRFGKTGHVNEDIAEVDVNVIPNHDLLVGGFPCQDYSVATTLKNSKGLIGKKGVLWWNIHKILAEKEIKPKYLFLENVDRLLISPSKQRGRDFAIILKSLDDLGYAVEWRVINAAEYGMPQRRKRVFILAYLKDTTIYKELKNSVNKDWILKDGVFAKSLPITIENKKVCEREFTLSGDIVTISENFNKNITNLAFENSGLMFEGNVLTIKTQSCYDGESVFLKDIIIDEKVDDIFYIKDTDLEKWTYLKGAKKRKKNRFIWL